MSEAISADAGASEGEGGIRLIGDIDDPGGTLLAYRMDAGPTADEQASAIWQRFDDAAAAGKKLRIYAELHAFPDVSAKLVVEKLKRLRTIMKTLERMALVGDQGWLEIYTGVVDPLTKPEIRHYSLEQKEEALTWLREGRATPPKYDPEPHWEALRQAMEQSGPQGVQAYVEAKGDDEQRQLYFFAQRSFHNRDWAGKDFDREIELSQLAIACGLRQAQAASDAETKAKRTDFANIVSYNLSANLAACWPGDERARERRHFEAGLQAAEACLRWRTELDKGPMPFSMAYWAQGMHQISLGQDASQAMTKALEAAQQFAEQEGQPSGVAADGSWLVCLSAGYLGLAERLAGQESTRYEQATAALKAMAEEPDKKGDADFCLAQLEVVATRYPA